MNPEPIRCQFESPRESLYQPCINVAKAIFPMIIAVGLNHIVESAEGDVKPHKLAYFTYCLLVFLRYLLGSEKHLSFEYIQRQPAKLEHGRKRFFKDCLFLVAFGVFALQICYASSVVVGLYWQGGLALISIVWYLVYLN